MTETTNEQVEAIMKDLCKSLSGLSGADAIIFAGELLNNIIKDCAESNPNAPAAAILGTFDRLNQLSRRDLEQWLNRREVEK